MPELFYLRTAPPYPFGAAPRDFPRSFLLYAGVDPLNLGVHEGKGYLLAMTPFDAALTLDLPAPPFPFGGNARRTPRAFTTQGKAVTIYPAATGNAARSSAPLDTPANTWVGGYLSGKFNYEIALFSGADPTRGGSATVGVLELEDPAGELDDLRTLGWDGAPLELRRGDPDALFSTFTTVAKLTTAGLRYNTRKKEIRLRDLAWKLMQAELHGLRYGGTGGSDGDATLAGRIKPYCIGSVYNITPVQISAASLIYQVSCFSVLGIDVVKDGGAALTLDDDHATYADLSAASVAAGHYATCKALGLFKLGAAPVYIITADVRGDNDTLNGIAYPHTRAHIARRIATGRGTVKLDDPVDIDGTAFEYLDQRQTATLGYYWDKEITKAEALAEVMAGCLGWWAVRLNGTIAVGQVEDPADVAPLFSLSYPTDDGGQESRVDEPAMTDYQPPRRSTLMGWSRNYTPLAVNQIAGAVPQSISAILQGQGRFTTSEDLWVAGSFPTSPVVAVNGGFVNESDAQLEGDRQRRLLRTRRDYFEIPAVIDPFADVAGRVINIANANRIGLDASRNLFCFGIAVNANAKPILKLWG
ncbi:MAG: hypothetical protein K2Y40_13630 [Reyranella sp.]|jgi:hypothetical protein|nr:hypothetical protein [Reyranella sp.]